MDALRPEDAMGSAQEIEALLVLESLPGVGPARVRAVVGMFGSARRALGQGTSVLSRALGTKAASALGDPRIRGTVARALARARELDMRIVAAGSPDYPARLLNLSDPPSVLFLRGDVSLLARGGVAVVGSRKATARGRMVSGRLGRAIARADVPVVSGLALGIDGAAHQGAVDVGGPTVAVLGRGADRCYPPSHATLFRRILREGLVVSEFLPGTPPLPHHFPRRNRILAALSAAVVVVEAKERSGALITVEHGLDLGLDVWSVPGPIDDPACAGSNELLADGARPLVSIDAFVRECFGSEPGDERDAGSLGQEGRSVLEALSEGPRSADEVAHVTALDVIRALTVLSELELDGWVSRAPGMRFRRAG